MGLFSSSGSKTASSSDTGLYEAPGRTSRVKCWDARDTYFQCLDRNNILDALKHEEDAARLCGKESQAFEGNCALSWVKYFKQRRVAEYEKEQLLKKQAAESFPSR
ncbi:hypothetical protein EJ06DRAFT_530605 [Trichodelitschia bisporula]|uniref:Cytochrome c oxidase, subunit VIb n=1 Tax=Trichodelitschia bisporula TaxID=703511 RepID=A0A6G1HUT0_9PEZI|nr:hypothetical protein EJ06DRAFT_530605 [Trichodelitschia bisporula]